MIEPSLPDKITAIHDALSRGKIPHAFGGALALAYYAEPRATVDIDVNVFVSPKRFGEVYEVLAILGVGDGVDPSVVERDGQCRLAWGRTPVDLFFAYDEVHDAMRRHVRTVPFGAASLPVLSPEHLVVCKVVFDRPKDWLDIEQVVVGVEQLDLGEIRGWLGRIVGLDDRRLRRLNRLTRQLLEE